MAPQEQKRFRVLDLLRAAIVVALALNKQLYTTLTLKFVYLELIKLGFQFINHIYTQKDLI